MFEADTACPGWGRRSCRSAAKTSSVPSSPSTDMAAATSATTSSSRRSWMARHSIPSMPSVPLMRARPSFSSSSTGRMPAAARASAAGIRSPSASRHVALAHEGECAVRQGGEVAGAAERAVLVDDRGDAGVQHRDVGGQRLLADAGAAGGERRDAQQHQRPHDLALDLGAGAGGVRADEGALQLVALGRRGCAGWPGRRSRWRRRSGARCRSASPRMTSRVRRTSTRDSSARRTGAP